MKSNSKLVELDCFELIHNAVKNIKVTKARTIIWRQVDEKTRVICDIRMGSIAPHRSEFQVTPKPGHEKNYEIILADTEEVNFFDMRNGVMFQGRLSLLRDEDKLAIIKFPELIAQIERRKDLRVRLDESQELYAKFSLPTNKTDHDQSRFFKKNCYDVSRSGLSFIVTKQDGPFFKKGKTIKNICMIIDGQELLFDAKVIKNSTIEANSSNGLIYNGSKIGLKIIRISEQQQNIIEDWVVSVLDFDGDQEYYWGNISGA